MQLGRERAQYSTGRPSAAVDTYRRGLRRVDQKLDVRQDPDLKYRAAVFSLNVGQSLRVIGDFDGTAENLNRGVGLMRQIAATRPDDKEVRLTLADGYAQLGAMFLDQGRREPALKNFRAGVAELEDLCRRSPLDPHTRHELMLAYSHVGDTLGNPGFDNLGDPAGTLDAYGKMVAAAQTLYDADSSDKRAVSDYGIALMRLAFVTPASQGAEKLQRLQQARQLLLRATRQNPKSTSTWIHQAWAETELGDLSRATDRSQAIRYYQAAVASSEAVLALDANSNAGQRRFVLALGKLSEQQARAGQREQAIAAVNKTLDLGKRVERSAPSSTTLRVVMARAWQVAGAVYAIFASMDSDEEQRHRDGDVAREWYARAVTEWRRMEPQPGFLDAYRKEMQSAITELGRQKTGLQGKKP